MKKITSLILVLIMVLSFLSSCGDGVFSKGKYTFTDSLGKTVTLDEKPRRVAVLFSSYVDIWIAAGGTVFATVYESVERGFVEDGTPVVDSGAGHTAIDTEALVALEPDFVITTADYAVQRETAEFMNSLGIPAASFSVESFEDYLSVLKIFTEILDTPERYELYGTAQAEKIAQIKASAVDKYEAESMLFVRAGTSKRSVKAKRAEDHFAAAMVEEFGFSNVADFKGELLDGLSLEAVVDANPCYVFVTFMGDESAASAYVDELFSKDGWRELDAVKSGRVIYLPKELFHFKPCTRWAQAYEYVYKEMENLNEE